jgi:hypothetical protein
VPACGAKPSRGESRQADDLAELLLSKNGSALGHGSFVGIHTRKRVGWLAQPQHRRSYYGSRTIMNEPPESGKRAVRSAWVSVIEAALVMFLLVEVSVLCLYFGLMSLVILVGPGGLETNQLIALAIHVMVAALSLIAFFGVGYCYFGVITSTSPVKWLLFALATFGVLVLPIASFTGADDSLVIKMRYLAGWSVLLFINTFAAFYYMDSRTVTTEEYHWTGE